MFVNGQWADLNATTEVKVNRVEEDREASWTAKMHNFAAAVRDGKPSPIDPRGVFLVNVIMDGIFRSDKEGREVEVSANF